MKRKELSRKLVFNKTTVAQLDSLETAQVKGGVIITVRICPQTDGCIYTNYGDYPGCPETMTLCGLLYCP